MLYQPGVDYQIVKSRRSLETREGQPEEEDEFDPPIGGHPRQHQGVDGTLKEEGEDGGDKPVEAPMLNVVQVAVVIVDLISMGGRIARGRLRDVGLLQPLLLQIRMVSKGSAARGNDGIDVEDADAVMGIEWWWVLKGVSIGSPSWGGRGKGNRRRQKRTYRKG